MYSLKYLLLLSCVVRVWSQKRPNIVVILTDDQDVVLGGMNPMKSVHQFIANEGAVFVNSFVASPICCPSRASILTGMYPHNHHTRNNSIAGGCNGHAWKQLENRTFAVILKEEAGYETFYAGKYLNQYGVEAAGGPNVVPPGWTEWHGLVGNSVYYNYTISSNGVPTYSQDLYLTDVIRNLGVTYIESQVTARRPFLMVLSPPAPHQPFTAAPRHAGLFANASALRTPSFNIRAQNKHWLMSMPPSPLPTTMLPELDRAHRARWETLLAVDELVADVIRALETANVLDDTYVIFTSDNGYHIGQFSQVYDKRQPYETDIRVPLAIRGPGVPRKTVNYQPTINVDLAPTIIKLAGLKVPETMDGVPLDLSAAVEGTDFKERNMLIEYHGEGSTTTVDADCPWKYDENLSQCRQSYACKCQDARNNTYACVRHLHPNINFKYCVFNETEYFEEIYDLNADPYELSNIAKDVLPAIKLWYRLALTRLHACAGASCAAAALNLHRA